MQEFDRSKVGFPISLPSSGKADVFFPSESDILSACRDYLLYGKYNNLFKKDELGNLVLYPNVTLGHLDEDTQAECKQLYMEKFWNYVDVEYEAHVKSTFAAIDQLLEIGFVRPLLSLLTLNDVYSFAEPNIQQLTEFNSVAEILNAANGKLNFIYGFSESVLARHLYNAVRMNRPAPVEINKYVDFNGANRFQITLTAFLNTKNDCIAKIDIQTLPTDVRTYFIPAEFDQKFFAEGIDLTLRVFQMERIVFVPAIYYSASISHEYTDKLYGYFKYQIVSRSVEKNGVLITPRLVSDVLFSNGIELGGEEKLSALISYRDSNQAVVLQHHLEATVSDPFFTSGAKEKSDSATTALSEQEAVKIVNATVYWDRVGKEGDVLVIDIYPKNPITDLIDWLNGTRSRQLQSRNGR